MNPHKTGSKLAESSLFIAILLSLPAFAQAEEPLHLGKSLSQWQAQLADKNETARLQAAQALGRIGPAAADALLVELDAKEASVRHWAAVGLGRIAAMEELPKASRERIVTALRKGLADEAATVRISAAVALADCGEIKTALPILEAALRDPIDGARIQAVSALHNLGEAARPALPALRAAKDDQTDYVVRLASRAVARLEMTAQP